MLDHWTAYDLTCQFCTIIYMWYLFFIHLPNFQIRVVEGKEPPHFLKLFDGSMVIHSGKYVGLIAFQYFVLFQSWRIKLFTPSCCQKSELSWRRSNSKFIGEKRLLDRLLSLTLIVFMSFPRRIRVNDEQDEFSGMYVVYSYSLAYYSGFVGLTITGWYWKNGQNDFPSLPFMWN